MKRLKLRPKSENFRYQEDIDKIVDACAAKGYSIDRETAVRAWEEYSDDLCAGWLMMPDDQESVWRDVSAYLIEDEEGV